MMAIPTFVLTILVKIGCVLLGITEKDLEANDTL